MSGTRWRRWLLGGAVGALGLSVAIGGGVAWMRARARLPPPATVEEREQAEALRDRLGEHFGERRLDLKEARAQAEQEERGGRQALALDTMAMAAVSGDPEAELAYAVQALRVPVPDRVRPEEARALVAVVAEEAPRGRLVPAARAWAALSREDPVGAMAALGEDTGTLEGRWARLRALGLLGQDGSAEAEEILKLDPDHEEACEGVARQALAQGDLVAARARAGRCLKAGAGGPALRRILADAADVAGRYEEAARAYEQAGASLHAAAVISQEGLADPGGVVAAALADPAPPAALSAVWIALLRGDLGAAEAAGARLDASGMPGPEAALAVAAGRLGAGDAAGALERTKGAGSAEALTLRARALATLGDDAGGGAAFDEAVRVAPRVIALHRERLAWAAARRPEALLEIARAAVGVDPLTLALVRGWRHRDAPWPVLAPSPWPELSGAAGLLARAVSAPQALEAGALAALEPGDRALVELHLGWAQAARGELAAARSTVEQAVGALPGNAGARALAAELALEAGDAAAVERWLAEGEGMATAPDAPGAGALAWVRAGALAGAGDLAGARAKLLEAARANPDHTGLWAGMLALDEAGSLPRPGPDRLTAALGSTR